MNSDIIASSEERKVSYEIHVITQCMALKNREISVVSDAFSTKYKLNTKLENIGTELITHTTDITGSGRASVTCPDIKSVLFISLTDAESTVSKEGSIVSIGEAKVIYLDCDGLIRCEKEKFELTAPGIYTERINGSIKGDLSYIHSQNGETVEISITSRYDILQCEKEDISFVSDLSCNEKEPIDLSSYPSFVICKCGEKKDLWNLAKDNMSEENAILKANLVADVSELWEKEAVIIPKVVL